MKCKREGKLLESLWKCESGRVHETMEKWHCSLCSHFIARNFFSVLRHIGQVHQFEPDFQVKCGLDGCPLRYMVYESFRVHVYKKHRNLLHNVNDHRDGTAHVEPENTLNDLQTLQE